MDPGAAARRRKKKAEALPFYAGVEQVDTDAINDRVIGKTRETVRSLPTSRPYTPMDTNRSLFGVSSGQATFGETSGPGGGGGGAAALDRPMSAFT